MVVVNKSTGKIEAVGKQAKEMLGKTPKCLIISYLFFTHICFKDFGYSS